MIVTMREGLSFEGACEWAWENFMRALEEL
jgi:hypothetical protein